METILLIDDSPDMLDLQRMVLELEGFKVITAQSGAEALDVLNKISEPQLILLDVQMEDMSGPQLLFLLEEKIPAIIENVPIVFLTAMDEVPKSKAMGFIRKAYDIDDFLDAVHRFVKAG